MKAKTGRTAPTTGVPDPFCFERCRTWHLVGKHVK